MGVFKNDVGRPSNKTVKIRRIITTIILLIIMGCLIVFAYTLGKENKIEENNIDHKKNITSNVSKNVLVRKKHKNYLINMFMINIMIWYQKIFRMTIKQYLH